MTTTMASAKATDSAKDTKAKTAAAKAAPDGKPSGRKPGGKPGGKVEHDFTPIMLTEEQVHERIKAIADKFGGEENLRRKEERNILNLDEMLALQRIDGYYYLLTGEC